MSTLDATHLNLPILWTKCGGNELLTFSKRYAWFGWNGRGLDGSWSFSGRWGLVPAWCQPRIRKRGLFQAGGYHFWRHIQGRPSDAGQVCWHLNQSWALLIRKTLRPLPWSHAGRPSKRMLVEHMMLNLHVYATDSSFVPISPPWSGVQRWVVCMGGNKYVFLVLKGFGDYLQLLLFLLSSTNLIHVLDPALNRTPDP